jgi:Tfp pilus assembly protein PilW
VLGRRSLIRLLPTSVVEGQWIDRGGELLLEDQREFTLLDRTGLDGDPERLQRMRTKRRSEDAAMRYVSALQERDEVAAGAFFEPGFARSGDIDLLERLPFLTVAELIGSVGPRTLVRVELEGGEQTIEYLWRDHDGVLAIVGARVFRPVE